MKVVLRRDESGVSEVVGTILILAMTVVLFSTIIVWVTGIPTPTAQTRVDLLGNLSPLFNAGGSELGDWINITHQGGESMPAATTVIYLVDQKSGSTTSKTEVIRLHPFKCTYVCVSTTSNTGTKNGMLDGAGLSWSVGQRFVYYSSNLSVSDSITFTIVDTSRGLVLWSQSLAAPLGQRPPIFQSVWASASLTQPTPITPVSGQPIYLFAKVTDPSGYSYIKSVYANLTILWGTSNVYKGPLKMYDDGSNGDQQAFDGVFTVARTSLAADISWDGSLLLFNATDTLGHVTTTRMTLHVVAGSSSSGGTSPGGNLTGRPPFLFWNGNQGYNIFNMTQWQVWTGSGVLPKPTRTFRGSESAIVVVGSNSLQDIAGSDTFNLWDPFSGSPQQSVVYGASKTVNLASAPSSLKAFNFYQFVNGYYIYTYQFNFNSGPGGTNFYTSPPQYPRYYYFANYPLSILLIDSQGNRFGTKDSINITAENGFYRVFPVIKTFSDSGYTQPATLFGSTATIYVQVNMLTVNANGSAGEGSGQVIFGNIAIQDFSGGQQLNRAPTSAIYSNLPICPPKGLCGSSNIAIWSDAASASYRFAINLARVDQDPWIAGTQNYALSIASIRDTDESYATVTTQVQVRAPLYKMDLAIGDDEGANPAWAGHVYAIFYQDFNGFDAWKPQPFDVCSGGTSTSGVAGGGNGKCPGASDILLAFGDFWHDGSLGLAESYISGPNPVVIYRRTEDASGSVIYLPVFYDMSPPATCTAIATGDLTGNGMPSVICGGNNGWVWYYANDGNWTRTYVDQPGSGSQINTVSVGDFNGDGWNDIAVGGASGYLKWYPNLGYGRFQNTGISDNWFAGTEQTLKGTVASGSYLSTYAQDGVYERVQEGPLNFSLQSNGIVNPGMDTSAVNWTFASAYNSATGAAQSSGGNPGSYVQVTAPYKASSTVAGYWYQPFTVSGSSPFTASLSLNYEITANTAVNGVTMAAFVNATCGKPPTTATTAAWNSGPITTTKPWISVSNINVGSLISTKPMSTPTSYCLEVVMYAAFGAPSVGSSTGGFDNVNLTWSSTPGTASALEQYWRFGPLPTRPGTAFTFNLYGHETGGTTAPEFDNFTISYATNVIGTDPTTGTYTTMFTVAGSSDVSYTFAMPSAVAGQTVWVRALDTNRVVSISPNYDSLYIDRMWINANTPSGTTGVTLAADGTTINMIDAQSSTHNGYYDLVAGTSGGKVYKYMGGAGGLTSSGLWYTAGTSVVGAKFGNFSTNYAGMAIAIAFGTTVRIIRGDVANTAIQLSLPAFSPSSTITAFAVGDINGDGWDDIAIGTTGGGVYVWLNLGQATSWTYAASVIPGGAGAPVFSLVLGDTTNSQYIGR